MNKWKKSAAIAIATLSLFGFGAWGVKALLSPSKVQAETAEITQTTPKMEIISQNVSYSESVYILYAVSNEGFDRNANEIKMLFWETPQENYDVTTATYVAEDKGSATVKGEDCLVFYSEGLSAKEMTVDLYCRAYTEIDGETYYSDVKKYSVLEYVYEKREKGGLTEAQGFLFDAMLNYGAAAQTYFEYKTDRLATEAFTYVRIANAMFADGFDYGLYKAGAEVEITLKEGYQLNLEYAEYLKETEDGKIILTVPAEKTVDESSVVKYSQGLTYSLNSDNASYTVTGIGTCKDTDLIIPHKYEGLPVTAIGSTAFYSKTNLTSAVLGRYVTSIDGHAFSNCSSLISVDFPDGLVGIGEYAFEGCSSLISVEFPDSLTSIKSSAFINCKGLKSVSIGDSRVNIGSTAFQGCNNLTRVYYKGNIATWCESTGMYTLMTNEVELYINNEPIEGDVVIPNGVTSIGDGAFYGGLLTSVIIPDSVTSIGEFSFNNCSNLTKVKMGNNVTDIGMYAFWNCVNLTDLSISEKVKTIGTGAFRACEKIVSVLLPNIVSIGKYAFAYCTDLQNIKLSNELAVIEEYAFIDCSNLIDIELSESLTKIGAYAFSGCDSLISVMIPDSVTSIGNYAFLSCDNLMKVEVAENNASYSDIEGNLYNKDKTILIQYAIGKEATEFTIPDSVISIGVSSFAGCKSLISIEISDSVTNIPGAAFSGCESLTKVAIPNSATSIGRYAFYECGSLTSIYYKGTAEEWTNISIDPSGNSYLTNATRYYYSKEEPALNADGTAYDGNYWHYVNDEVVVWTKTEE